MDVRPVCGFLRQNANSKTYTVRCTNPAVSAVEWQVGVLIPACAECAGASTTFGNWGTSRPGRR